MQSVLETDLLRRHWDAVIIGTGMGGATLGYALARAGWRVLFCEKGKTGLKDSEALRGKYAEMFFARPDHPQVVHRETLRRAGRCWEEIDDVSFSKPRRFIPFIGSGTGGSTALYGMALERFFPADFTPRKFHPDAVDSTLPDSWPISYSELEPYYTMAEKLFGVRGDADPLRGDFGRDHRQQPPEFSPAAQEMFDFFQRQGLRPYRLPLACDRVPDCRGCQGYLCARACKNDSARVCLTPAINQHGAQLLDECEVLRLKAAGGRVTGVMCRWQGREVELTGDIVVLAAGALFTPALLLRSASGEWPNGLANESGWVGRNLMRHYVDLYAVFPKVRHGTSATKELACNDYYVTGENKFGSIQSFGAMPPAPILVESMQQDLYDGFGSWAAAGFWLAKPVLRPFLRWLFARAMVFATVEEDLPYLDNRLLLASDDRNQTKVAIKYHITAHEKQRIEDFRRRVQAIFKPYRSMVLKQAENNQRIAHVCGTCRFGTDPRRSVLDPNNRAHGLVNLYVVDASFFPSSGGTNPALTIAANALRVAAHLVNTGMERARPESTENRGE